MKPEDDIEPLGAAVNNLRLYANLGYGGVEDISRELWRDACDLLIKLPAVIARLEKVLDGGRLLERIEAECFSALDIKEWEQEHEDWPRGINEGLAIAASIIRNHFAARRENRE